jgi:hypothetical protein
MGRPMVQRSATGYGVLQMTSTHRGVELQVRGRQRGRESLSVRSPHRSARQTVPAGHFLKGEARSVSHCARPTRGVRDRALREHRRPTGYSSAPWAKMIRKEHDAVGVEPLRFQGIDTPQHLPTLREVDHRDRSIAYAFQIEQAILD